MRKTLVAVPVVALAAAFAGCAGEEQAAPVAQAPPPTVTVIETRQAPAPAPAPTPTPTPAPAAEAESGGIVVPDVVGRDHQYAQDTMQAAGLYNLAEEDATGQGRALLWDRNWVVVSQSPAAGTRVGEGTTIVLRSKKEDE